MGVNKCSFSGICVKPPKMVRSQSGMEYCLMSLSTTTRVKVGEDWEDRNAIIDFIAFKPKSKYIQKAVRVGSVVSVEATYTPTEVRGKDGKLKLMPLFKVDEIEAMNPKGQGGWHSSEWI